MRIVRIYTRIPVLFLILLCLHGTSCSSSNGSGNKTVEVLIPVQRTVVTELVDTLSAAIQHRQHNTVMALYTAASATAVLRSVNAGLGTAGSIDDTILLEFELNEKKENPIVEIIRQSDSKMDLKLPSGKRISVVLAQENGGWAIDVLASPGGEILLLTD